MLSLGRYRRSSSLRDQNQSIRPTAYCCWIMPELSLISVSTGETTTEHAQVERSMAKIFISYRRQDSIGVTGRIYDRLRGTSASARARLFLF